MEDKTTIKVNDINKLDALVNKFKDKNVDIELAEKKNTSVNPWAICNKKVGTEDKVKFESCVKSIKNKSNIDEEIVDDVDKLIELITSRLSSQLSKINTPSEKAKLIIHFANLLNVPSNKIGHIVSSIKAIGNNSNLNELKIILNNLKEYGE